MDSGYDAKLLIVEDQYKQDLKRLDGLTEKADIKNFMNEMNSRLSELDLELFEKKEDVEQNTMASPLSQKIAEDEKEITEKKIQYVRELLESADKKLNPEYFAAKERASSVERRSSFVTAKVDTTKRSSLREDSSLLGRTRTSSIGESPFKTARSSSLGTTGIPQPSPRASFVKTTRDLPPVSSVPTGSTSITNDIGEIDRLFRQAAGQGYKKENTEEIVKYLTNLASTLFLQIRETDVINPKRHKAKDSTDLRYSQFSNQLSEILMEQFKRLDDKLKEIDESKAPAEKQKIMEEKEKYIKMLLTVADGLREKRNFIALMSVALIVDSQLAKRANAEIKDKISEKDLNKLKIYANLYAPGSSELTKLQQDYLKDKMSVVPHIGAMKYRFVYIDEYKNDEKKRESAQKQEDELVALFKLYQSTLAKDLKQNLAAIKLKYNEVELHETEQQAKEKHDEISHAPNVEMRHKLYEELMENIVKRTNLLQEQSELLEKATNALKSKDMSLEFAYIIRDLKGKKKSILEETSDTKNAMLFNEAKLIASLPSEQIIENYSKSLSKLSSNIDIMLSKLSDDKMPLAKRIELLKEADLIMHELDIKAKAITHRSKDVTFSGEQATQLFKDIDQISIKKENLLLIKNSIERNLGTTDSIVLHSTPKSS